MARAIDANELEMFPYAEVAGTEEQIADWIEQVGLSGDDTASRARNLCWKVIEGFINVVKTQPTLTPQNEWVSVEDRLPELPNASWCSRSIIVCDKDGNVAPLLWEREQVRGKTMERWKYHWGRIYDVPEIAHWMPLPAPPGKDNNVLAKEQNEPLTIEQLREMDGEPAWIYRCGHAGTDDYCALWEFETFPSREAALGREQDG